MVTLKRPHDLDGAVGISANEGELALCVCVCGASES